MKTSAKILFCFFILLVFQKETEAQFHAQYYIQFRYKKSNYDLQNPLAYLSQRAIDRRTKQNISFDSLDLPVVKYYLDSIKNHSTKICGITKWLNGAVIEVSDSSQLLYLINYFSFVKSFKKVKLAEKSTLQSKFSAEQLTKFNPSLNCCANNSNYGWAANQITQMHGEDLHSQNFKGNGMQIAILDGGFTNIQKNSSFQNLWQEGRIAGFRNFVFQTDSVFTDAEHGGAVLSIMGVNLPNIFVGTAPQATFYLFETEDNFSENSSEEYFWSMGAEAADSIGVDLINSSLGYTTFDAGLNNHQWATDMDGKSNPSAIAASIAGSKGILVCVAAGNSGNSSWHYISSPADADNILTMGSVDINRKHSTFSSWGPSADRRVKPDVCTMGENTIVVGESNTLNIGSGTSFASPLLCGMAACLWQKYPNKSAAEIRQAIRQCSHLFASPNDSMGYGIPDFRIADMLLSGINNPLFDENNKPFLFPNPSPENCSIYSFSNSDQQAYAELYDLIGKLITTNYWNELKTIVKGLYLIRFRINNNTYNLKWVKE